MESQTLGHFNAATLSLSVRWAALDKRLIAPAEKIEKINAGKVKVNLSEYERKEPDNSETKASDKAEQNTEPASFAGKSHSFSIDKAMVRQNTTAKTEDVQPEEISVPEVSACEAVPDTNPEPVTSEVLSSEPHPTEQIHSGSPEQADFDGSEHELPEAFPDEENIPYVSEALVRQMADFWRMQELIECAPP